MRARSVNRHVTVTVSRFTITASKDTVNLHHPSGLEGVSLPCDVSRHHLMQPTAQQASLDTITVT